MNPTQIPNDKACMHRGSTIKRLESTLPKDHEDHIAGKGYKSMSHYNLVHKFLPMPQSMKIPDAKAAVHKEWKNRNDTSLAIGQDEEQKGCYSGSTKRARKKGPLCHIRDSVQLHTVLALYEQENFRNNEQPSYSRLKTPVTRHIDQIVRTRNFKARNERIGTGVATKSQKGTEVSVERQVGECSQ